MQKKNKNLYLCFSNLAAIKHWGCIISIETKIRGAEDEVGWDMLYEVGSDARF